MGDYLIGEDYGSLLDLGNGQIVTYFPRSSARETFEARGEACIGRNGVLIKLGSVSDLIFFLKGPENILEPLNCVPQQDAFDYNFSSLTDAVSLGES